ncbi:unnamed protein product, partial [Sphacelaria rigidula]
ADIGLLEVAVEQLSPSTYDLIGVVDALQKEQSEFLGPGVVSRKQLERLVSRLLINGLNHLPQEYPREPEHYVAIAAPSAKPSALPKLKANNETEGTDCPSTVPTPAATPDV